MSKSMSKSCLLELVVSNFQEEVFEAVDYKTGGLCIDYSLMNHQLEFDINIHVVECIYSPI